MVNIACDSLRNFRYEGKVYSIITAGIDGAEQPYCMIEPHDTIFHDVLLAHIKEHRAIKCDGL